MVVTRFRNEQFSPLDRGAACINGSVNGLFFTASLTLKDYHNQLKTYYGSQIDGDLNGFCNRYQLPLPWDRLGLVLSFARSTELALYDRDLAMDQGLRDLVDRYGMVSFRNVHLDRAGLQDGHRNRFPHLSFHVDRSANQPTPYSFFCRNPFDAEQKQPRTASTLVLPKAVAYLLCLKEGQLNRHQQLTGAYTLFEKEDIEALFSTLILRQAWNEPAGTGEIAIIDNRLTFHASYYNHRQKLAYRIGVRYVC